MEYFYHYESPLGGIIITSDGEALTGLRFDRQQTICGSNDSDQEDSEPNHDSVHAEEHLPVFKQTIKWLDIYFSGEEPGFTPPLRMEATAFRKMVWEILLTIPYGETMSYGEIADLIAKQKGIRKMSAQAVGGAVGNNPISLIIPCHRVIGADGSMVGYGSGIDKKIKLLELESGIEFEKDVKAYEK